MRDPLVVDKWREWRAAKQAASRGRRLRDAGEDEKRRAWRHLMTHLKAALTGVVPDERPEQPKLFDE
jgi:hypothetical protein